MRNLRGTLVALAATVAVQLQAGAIAQSQTKVVPPPPPPGLEMLWQRPLPAYLGRMAPSLAIGGAFLFLASPEAGLTAYTPEDGRPVRWAKRFPSLPPVAVGLRVAVVSDGVLDVLSENSDKPAWQSDVAPDTTAIFAFGDRLGAIAGGELRTWEADGAPSWRAQLGGTPTTPFVVRDRLLFVGLDEPSLLAIDTATGAVRWRVRLPAKPESLAATDDRLYLGAANGTLYSYRTSGSARPAWAFRLLRTIGQPVVDDRQVYFALLDNSVRAFARKGGSQRWSRVLPSRAMTGPFLLGTSVAVALDTGRVLDLAATDGRVRAPASPVTVPDVRLQAAAVARDGQRLYTVTTAKDFARTLTAWGRPTPKK